MTVTAREQDEPMESWESVHEQIGGLNDVLEFAVQAFDGDQHPERVSSTCVTASTRPWHGKLLTARTIGQ